MMRFGQWCYVSHSVFKRTCNCNVCFVAKERKEEGGKEGGGDEERQIERERQKKRQTEWLVRYKRLSAREPAGVTHAPQGRTMQGLLLPSHSCLWLRTDHWAGVCQKFIFISPLLTAKTAWWSVRFSIIKCFLLKYLGAKMNMVCSNNDFHSC